MATKFANLQSALDKTRAAPATIAPSKPVIADSPPVAASRQANRQGKVNLAAWLHPDFKNHMRLVQARRPGTIQELMEEAFNDLFAKYDVPQVTATDGAEAKS